MNIEHTDISTKELHIWKINLNNRLNYSEIKSILSVEELEREARYKNANARQQFIFTRYALRIILGRYLLMRPEDIKFKYTQYKKPYLHDPTKNLFFNISHSESLALCAIALDYNLGVDIELCRPLDNILNLARTILSNAEYENFINIPEKNKLITFYKSWVRKEAFLKAIGTGLLYPIQEINLLNLQNVSSINILQKNKYDKIEKEYWSEFNFKYLNEKYFGAVFVHGNIKKTYFYNFQE